MASNCKEELKRINNEDIRKELKRDISLLQLSINHAQFIK
uniref:Uncharacterized protein n=1 Tax=Acrobeloides nanus TaxID=290746 RepID=A0A914C7W6_9BILA